MTALCKQGDKGGGAPRARRDIVRVGKTGFSSVISWQAGIELIQERGVEVEPSKERAHRQAGWHRHHSIGEKGDSMVVYDRGVEEHRSGGDVAQDRRRWRGGGRAGGVPPHVCKKTHARMQRQGRGASEQGALQHWGREGSGDATGINLEGSGVMHRGMLEISVLVGPGTVSQARGCRGATSAPGEKGKEGAGSELGRPTVKILALQAVMNVTMVNKGGGGNSSKGERLEKGKIRLHHCRHSKSLGGFSVCNIYNISEKG
ncbi:hypothetical protein B0H13DRAFT_1885411 [Mycena leptocephala]|nr:hypothetical protein B0H13DRAFT_1885411 [Mycena leptocephala]